MRTSTSSGFDLWEALDDLRDTFAPRMTGRADRRDVRFDILNALEGGAKNGHEIMQALASRGPSVDGPTASVVYPTLELLVDEGLVSSEHVGERRVFSLTEAGRAAARGAAGADEHTTASAGEDGSGWRAPRFAEHSAAVPKAGAKLAQAAAQVAQHGTTEQKERAAALLDETRRKIYAILAEG
ncbi:PadR family transcriptional regulator [uncultured Schumannella sp.]|uniref:PadR family transcriptional regulator n=1 Tax=uncultured Schumannella sp. TaxID=1195956 RepID=UPI0025D17710|nr:PadR family transcriptional regulator [uncultured Schumannella sp.]